MKTLFYSVYFGWTFAKRQLTLTFRLKTSHKTVNWIKFWIFCECGQFPEEVLDALLFVTSWDREQTWQATRVACERTNSQTTSFLFLLFLSMLLVNFSRHFSRLALALPLAGPPSRDPEIGQLLRNYSAMFFDPQPLRREKKTNPIVIRLESFPLGMVWGSKKYRPGGGRELPKITFNHCYFRPRQTAKCLHWPRPPGT